MHILFIRSDPNVFFFHRNGICPVCRREISQPVNLFIEAENDAETNVVLEILTRLITEVDFYRFLLYFMSFLFFSQSFQICSFHFFLIRFDSFSSFIRQIESLEP